MSTAAALAERDWLSLRASLTPAQPAIIDPATGRAASWAALHQAVEQTARAWRAKGATRVTIHDADPSRVIVAFLAGLTTHAVTVVLNMRLTESERHQQWLDVGSPLIAGTSIKSGQTTVPISDFDFDITEIVESKNRSLRDEHPELDGVLTLRNQPHTPAALGLFTSGTTGRSRCALLPRHALLASAVASAQVLGENDDDRWLACLPLFHIGGLSIVVRSIVSGAPIVLLPSFDERAVAAATRRFLPTLASFVPTMLGRLLDAHVAPGSLRACLIGGGPSPAALLRRARDAGWPARATYGLTEAASQVATARDATTIEEHRVGQPLPGNSIRIDAPDADHVGEIVVDGPTLMLGYLDRDTSLPIRLDGPLHTGDIGRIGPDGALEVFARRSDLILSGGENVYPAEVEASLCACPAVDEVAVVGIDDAEWGQRVAALVVLRPHHTIDEVEQFARAQLGGHRRPRLLVATSSLPRNSLQKIDRNAAREMICAAQATSPT